MVRFTRFSDQLSLRSQLGSGGLGTGMRSKNGLLDVAKQTSSYFQNMRGR